MAQQDSGSTVKTGDDIDKFFDSFGTFTNYGDTDLFINQRFGWVCRKEERNIIIIGAQDANGGVRPLESRELTLALSLGIKVEGHSKKETFPSEKGIWSDFYTVFKPYREGLYKNKTLNWLARVENREVTIIGKVDEDGKEVNLDPSEKKIAQLLAVKVKDEF